MSAPVASMYPSVSIYHSIHHPCSGNNNKQSVLLRQTLNKKPGLVTVESDLNSMKNDLPLDMRCSGKLVPQYVPIKGALLLVPS